MVGALVGHGLAGMLDAIVSTNKGLNCEGNPPLFTFFGQPNLFRIFRFTQTPIQGLFSKPTSIRFFDPKPNVVRA